MTEIRSIAVGLLIGAVFASVFIVISRNTNNSSTSNSDIDETTYQEKQIALDDKIYTFDVKTGFKATEEKLEPVLGATNVISVIFQKENSFIAGENISKMTSYIFPKDSQIDINTLLSNLSREYPDVTSTPCQTRKNCVVIKSNSGFPLQYLVEGASRDFAVGFQFTNSENKLVYLPELPEPLKTAATSFRR